MANIFISYRRDDSIATAGRIRDRLVQEFGRKQVFVDVDDIPHGQDFARVLREKVAECRVLLAIVGPHWMEVRDAQGNRRIDNPSDFVGIEIGTGLARKDLVVIPVLVDGAKMPEAADLPPHLQGLAGRNAIELRNMQFGSDAERLLRSITSVTGSGWSKGWKRSAVAIGILAVFALAGSFALPSVWRETLLGPFGSKGAAIEGQVRLALNPAQGTVAWIYVGSRIGDEWKHSGADGLEPELTLDVSGLPIRGQSYRVTSGGLTLRTAPPVQRPDKSRPAMAASKGTIGPGSRVKVDDVVEVQIDEGVPRRWVWARVTVVEAK